jgi:hypothetical protein
LGALGLGACASGFYGEARLLEFPPPLVPIQPARATIIPHSQDFSLAILNFVDQTGKAGQITEALPDALSTLYFASGRFSVYDRGQLRHDDFGQLLSRWQKHQKHEPSQTLPAKDGGLVLDRTNQPFDLGALREDLQTILRRTDSIFLGAVTEIQDSMLSLDYRLINSQSNTVLYAGDQKIRFTRTGSQIEFNRDDLKRMVRLVINALPDPSALRIAQVLVQDGPILTINLGKKDKIVPGLNALLLAPGDQIIKTPTGSEIRNVMYLAEAYVVAVYDESCKLVVFHADEQTPDYKVGDFVRFK